MRDQNDGWAILQNYKAAENLPRTLPENYPNRTSDGLNGVVDGPGGPIYVPIQMPVVDEPEPEQTPAVEEPKLLGEEIESNLFEDAKRWIVRGVGGAGHEVTQTFGELSDRIVTNVNRLATFQAVSQMKMAGQDEAADELTRQYAESNPNYWKEGVGDAMQAVQDIFMPEGLQKWSAAEFGTIGGPRPGEEGGPRAYNYPGFANLAEMITQFAAGAVPFAKAVKLMGVQDPIARGLVWGYLADFAAMDPDSGLMTDMLTGFLETAPDEERGPVAEHILDMIMYRSDDPALVKRAKMAYEGFVVGLAAEGAMKLPGATKGLALATAAFLKSDAIPWDEIGRFWRDKSGTLKPRPDAVEDVSEIGFYSAVMRAVDALPQDKGTAVQMRQMIAKAEGVKPEEMAWIGLDEFLKDKKSVTKQEIKDFVEANQVRVEEVTLGSASRLDVETEMATDIQDVLEAGQVFDMDAQDALESWKSSITRPLLATRRRFRSQHEALLEEKLRDAGDLRTVEEFREAASANVEPTKYGTPDLTLPGGKNYREVVLTMPSTKRLDEAAARLREFESSMKDESGRSLHKHEWPEGAEAEWDRLNEQIASGKPYRGGHYGGDHPNTLAHIRLNDRTGPNGEKILFIEEIQSDWHQKGRKKGYRDGPRFTGKLSAKEMDGGIGWEITDENDNFVTNVLKTEGPGHIQFEPAGMGTLERVTVATADDALAVAQSRINNPDVGSLPVDDRVPNAPLKTSWHEMSLRRVLRMAAEEGYDSVAWTPGKVQADRYNLRKRVSEIRYAGTNLKVYGLDGETVLENTGVKHEDLPDIIGKEAADRLLAQTPDAGLRSLVGEELEIGGEGMKGFYDEMIKNYAAKFGKKFGAKVGVMDMPTKYSDNLKSDVYHVVNNNGEVIETFKRRRDADVRAEELGEGFGIKIDVDEAEEVWTIPITKRMRDSLMQEGAPLFSAAPIIPGAIAAGQQEQPAAQ